MVSDLTETMREGSGTLDRNQSGGCGKAERNLENVQDLLPTSSRLNLSGTVPKQYRNYAETSLDKADHRHCGPPGSRQGSAQFPTRFRHDSAQFRNGFGMVPE